MRGRWRKSYDDFRLRVREADNAARRPANRLRYWLREARGLFIDRSGCAAEPAWRCDLRYRWTHRRVMQEGPQTLSCGCRIYRTPPSAHNLTVQTILAEENASVCVPKMHVYGLDHFLLDAGTKVIDE